MVRSAKAPGQYSIGTGGQYSFGRNRLRFAEPFPALLIGLAIRNFVAARNSWRLKTSIAGLENGLDGMTYLKHVGFFTFTELERAQAQANGGQNYIPITSITRSELNEQEGNPIQQEIDSISDRLAAIIFPEQENAGPSMMLSYCLREIIRNSFEHADIDACHVMAQRYAGGVAEIAIADDGVGVLTSLSSTFEVTDPVAAIELALQPGITSGANHATEGQWGNSGYGLYVTSELGRQYGDFCIASSGVLYTPANAIGLPIAMTGTVVKLRINTKDADVWPNILSSIVSVGERIACERPGAIRKASGSSKNP